MVQVFKCFIIVLLLFFEIKLTYNEYGQNENNWVWNSRVSSERLPNKYKLKKWNNIIISLEIPFTDEFFNIPHFLWHNWF